MLRQLKVPGHLWMNRDRPTQNHALIKKKKEINLSLSFGPHAAVSTANSHISHEAVQHRVPLPPTSKHHEAPPIAKQQNRCVLPSPGVSTCWSPSAQLTATHYRFKLTKDSLRICKAFAFIFGVNWLWHCGVTASFGVFFHGINGYGMTSCMELV